jgi:hypothetical protein
MRQLADFGVSSPSGRDTSAVYNQSLTLSRTVRVTPGMYAAGWLLDVYMTPTGSGTGTAYVADSITRVEIRDENGEIVYRSQGKGSLGLTALFSHVLAGIKGVTAIKDVVVAASATPYRGWWKHYQNMKGQMFTVEVDIDPALLAGLTLTALASSMNFSIIESDEQGEQVDLIGLVQTTATRFESKDAYGVMLELAAEFGATFSEMVVDKKNLSTEEIVRVENETAILLNGLHTAGAEGAVQFIPGIYGPNTGAQGYYFAAVGEDYLNVSGSLSSSTLLVAKAIPAKLDVAEVF